MESGVFFEVGTEFFKYHVDELWPQGVNLKAVSKIW
jgi:hypothetical protein